MISEKDDALAEKEQQIQEQYDKTAKLEAELAEYHKRDKVKEQRHIKRKKTAHVIWGGTKKLAILGLAVIIGACVCSKINNAYTNAVSLVVGIVGAVPTIISFFRTDIKIIRAEKKNVAEETAIEH